MQWTLVPIVNALLNSNGWKKLLDPFVGQGTVGWPKQSVDQERYGICYCYDGEILLDGIIYHKYHMKPMSLSNNCYFKHRIPCTQTIQFLMKKCSLSVKKHVPKLTAHNA